MVEKKSEPIDLPRDWKSHPTAQNEFGARSISQSRFASINFELEISESIALSFTIQREGEKETRGKM